MRIVYKYFTVIFLFISISWTCVSPALSGGAVPAEEGGAGNTNQDISNLPYGHDYFTLRGGLENCRIRFDSNKSGRVAFLGGSITHNPGWREMVSDYLENRFPETDFEFINAGIPSMGSTPGAFRIGRDVLSKGSIDLLFVEAAVNDSTNSRSAVEQVRGMEGIVRQAWNSNPDTDIVFLYFADTGKTSLYNQGKSPDVIENHEKVASFYGISSLNLALEVSERIRFGQFEWDRDFKDVHPSPFGQDLYARSITRMLNELWSNPNTKRAVTISKELPAALLDKNSYLYGRLVDINGAETGPGWEIKKNWQPVDSAGTREGFVKVPMLESKKPGAELKFNFRGKAVGIFVTAGPDAGIIEYSIDGGPVKTLDLFTRWSSHLHLPWAHVLEAETTVQKSRTLMLKVSQNRNPESTGHAVRIAHFLVN
jgi:lysophospholipase L1-like esterase